MRVALFLGAITGALVLSGGGPAHAYPASDIIICRVMYQVTRPEGDTQFNGDEVSVKTSELAKLPRVPAVKTLVAGTLGLSDFNGTLRDETDSEIITYTGQFTALMARELFLPHGSPVVLKPQVYFPAETKDGAPEIYTTKEQNGLRAIWLRTPLFGDRLPPLEDQYFAVLVQLYDYVTKPMKCHFTGVRTVSPKTFWGKSLTENLKDAETNFVNAPVRKISVYPAISAMRM